MKLETLLREAGFSPPNDIRVGQIEVTGISSDSRKVKKGELFVALRGLHYDGCGYIAEAFARGASFALCERCVEGKNTMQVPDAREALARLHDAWYGHPAKGMSLIGVTGTNGKTSVTGMLFWILRRAGHHTGMIGTVESRMDDAVLDAGRPESCANMTTPDPADLYRLLREMRDMGAEYVVMEVTSHALAFKKVAPLHFKRAVFTNLTPDHLDLHGDMEAYFLEKRKLFDRCEQAVISTCGPYGRRLCEELECPFDEVGEQSLSEVKHEGAQGVSFTLRSRYGTALCLRVPVPGRFTVENAALAAMTASSLSLGQAQICEALSTFSGVRGRMERIEHKELDITVFLDYAHTPDALEKLLLTVRDFASPHARILLLFGCGGERDRTKRPEMGRVGSRLADLLVLTSDNCRNEEPQKILEDILRGVDKEKPYVVIKDRKQAIFYAVENARAGDILILAGKGHEEYEIRGNLRLPFSEREIVHAALLKKAGGDPLAH